MDKLERNTIRNMMDLTNSCGVYGALSGNAVNFSPLVYHQEEEKPDYVKIIDEDSCNIDWEKFYKEGNMVYCRDNSSLLPYTIQSYVWYDGRMYTIANINEDPMNKKKIQDLINILNSIEDK